MVKENKLNAYIALAGVKDRDVAKELGITPTTFCNKKKGRSDFSTSQVSGICKYLKIPDDDIGPTFGLGEN